MWRYCCNPLGCVALLLYAETEGRASANCTVMFLFAVSVTTTVGAEGSLPPGPPTRRAVRAVAVAAVC